MYHPIDALSVYYGSLGERAQRQNEKPFSSRVYKVFILVLEQKPCALTFPQLKAFMSKNKMLLSSLSDIHDHHIVSVDVYALVADHQFLHDISVLIHFLVDLQTGVTYV